MSREHLKIAIFFLFFKLLLSLNNENFIYHCKNDELSIKANEILYVLENLSTNVTNLFFICNTTMDFYIDSEVFPPNMSIKSVTFRGFNLKLFPNCFKNLIDLQSLVINHCQFFNIYIDAFGGLTELNVLDLSFNNMTTINHLWIPQTIRIDILNFSNNYIQFFSEHAYQSLRQSVNIIDLRKNKVKCHCINQWMNEINNINLIKDDNNNCTITNCIEAFTLQSKINVTVYSFKDVTVDCPINVSSSFPSVIFWISPHKDVFGPNTSMHHAKNNVGIVIQPLFIESFVSVNTTTHSLTITTFRGYFSGSWTCMAQSISGYSMSNTVNLQAKVRLKEIFDFSVSVGFTFAGCWLLIAICVGLVQYCKETSCCHHRIDYNKSSLFERRYAQTVIPVPMEDSVSDTGSNDSELNCSRPLNNLRSRHESHNNDVQLIFTDEHLADQYAQMLSDLKDASEIGDENFYNRLRDMRTRFSLDFSRMRFDIKRGMESLRSNSTAAAHKLRKGVVHMKDHMKSFTEFCGTASIAQSISIVVIPENSNHTDEIGGDIERHHKRTVFNFFAPC